LAEIALAQYAEYVINSSKDVVHGKHLSGYVGVKFLVSHKKLGVVVVFIKSRDIITSMLQKFNNELLAVPDNI
jgi:hypothetical protein